ncbi:MAG: nucleoid-associated protein, partial [Vagococcus sp.]
QLLKRAVIHKIDKAAGEPAIIKDAKVCLSIEDTPLKTLVNQVHTVYSGKSSKSYGKFDKDLTLVSAENHLIPIRDEKHDADFLKITVDLMSILKAKSDGENFSTGGHVLFAESTASNIKWLLIAVLNNKDGTSISEELKVLRSTHLDIEGIRFAGRVNMTSWKDSQADRYISFLKGKNNDVSKYFQEFLGCKAVQQELSDTRNLVAAVKKFADSNCSTETAKEDLLKDVYKYADEKIKEGKTIDLVELSNRIWPSEPALLQKTLNESDPPIPDDFRPIKRGLDGLKRFTAKAKNWKLDFDRDAIQTRTIEFDEDKKTLTIKNLPEDILNELIREFKSDDDETATE